MACMGQFSIHAPHSIQESRFRMRAFPSDNSKTACGHTFVHIPQPLHFSSFSCRVTTSFKYTKSFILDLQTIKLSILHTLKPASRQAGLQPFKSTNRQIFTLSNLPAGRLVFKLLTCLSSSTPVPLRQKLFEAERQPSSLSSPRKVRCRLMIR
jgi:hypothetical protein